MCFNILRTYLYAICMDILTNMCTYVLGTNRIHVSIDEAVGKLCFRKHEHVSTFRCP